MKLGLPESGDKNGKTAGPGGRCAGSRCLCRGDLCGISFLGQELLDHGLVGFRRGADNAAQDGPAAVIANIATHAGVRFQLFTILNAEYCVQRDRFDVILKAKIPL